MQKYGANQYRCRKITATCTDENVRDISRQWMFLAPIHLMMSDIAELKWMIQVTMLASFILAWATRSPRGHFVPLTTRVFRNVMAKLRRCLLSLPQNLEDYIPWPINLPLYTFFKSSDLYYTITQTLYPPWARIVHLCHFGILYTVELRQCSTTICWYGTLLTVLSSFVHLAILRA